MPRSRPKSRNRDPAPCRADGTIAWFTPLHNAWLERVAGWAPGAVLEIYQRHLVPVAQRLLAEHGDFEPPAYDEDRRQNMSNANGDRRNDRRAWRNGMANMEHLDWRNAARGLPIPSESPLRRTASAASRRRNQRGFLPAAVSAVTAAVAAQTRVWRGRVGDAGNSGSVSSRTRSRSRGATVAGRRNERRGS